MNEVNKLIEVAKAEIGYLEKKTNKNLDSKTANAGSGNYTKYARDLDNIKGFYNGKKNGYPWCDVFVDWCFVKAFGEKRAKELLNHGTLGAGCKYSMDYYKKKKQFYTTPEVGDQIFFKNDKGSITHTGIVIKKDSKKVYTIEGNTSADKGVVANGGSVNDKNYSLGASYIAGYGRPKFKVEEPKKEEPKKEETKKKTYSNGAESFNSKYRSGKSFKVNSKDGLYLRDGATMEAKKICLMPNKTKVMWYGFYTDNWKYVKVANGKYKGKVGFCSENYLK